MVRLNRTINDTYAKQNIILIITNIYLKLIINKVNNNINNEIYMNMLNILNIVILWPYDPIMSFY